MNRPRPRFLPRPAWLALGFAAALAAGCAHLGPPAAAAPDTVPACPADAQRLEAPPPDWAALDGRTVCITAPLTITGNHRLGEGELLAAFGGRLATPTERARPGPEAQALARDNARRLLPLAGLPPVASDDAGTWRTGGTLRGVAGQVALDARGQPSLRVAAAPQVTPARRPPAPTVPGDVRIAALNLHNLFNGDGLGGGFPTPRGAGTAPGFARQQAQLVATLQALDADVAALMELENDGDGPQSSLTGLLAALRAGGGDWRAVQAPGGAGPGSDQIRVALVYRADRLQPAGRAAVLRGGPFETLSRVPLAQAFRAGDGPAFTVAAVHLKSKGCGSAAGAERNQSDGQACWNPTRVDSVRRLRDWLATDPTASGGDLAVMIGDFNAYAQEDPIRLLADAGWRDAFAGQDPARSYSFVYDGQAGRLDHALLSPALAPRLAGAAKWHANSDEVPVDEDRAAAAAPGAATTPWGASDHDPLLIGLRLRGRGP